ncbi:MAG: TonB-dependent receptor [Nitrospirae bacterium]|nr:TonB-dependent receptor [Nitrospirota bacterium]MBI3593439.1 TonB-dependent receptor [Nitrospirota bacterium]
MSRKSLSIILASLTELILLLVLTGRSVSAGPLVHEGELKDLNLEEMITVDVPTVEGASKFEQIVTEAPSSVTVVTSAEIKKLGYRTLADILQSLRGFDITYDRNYSYSGVRGYGRPGDYNDKILLLIDGHRINDNITNQAPLGTEFSIDIDLIDSIEIIRGPGSSLYGNNAFFAVIDVHTKNGRDLKGTEISTDAGSYDNYKGRLSYGTEYSNGFEGVASGTGYASRGQSLYYPEYNSPLTNNGLADNRDSDQSKSVFTKFSYHGITLENSFSSRTKGVPTGSFGADFNQANQSVDSLFFSDLKIEKRLGSGGDAMARVYYDYYSYTGDFFYSGVDNKDLERGERVGGELKYSVAIFNDHKLVIGGEYLDNLKQQQQNYDILPNYTYLDDNRRSRIIAEYLQLDLPFFLDWITLNAGFRHDEYDTFGHTYNPRLGLILNPFQKSYFKLLYGSAFRAPNVYELYYASPGLQLEGNPNLKPEKIQTFEGIYDQYFLDGYRATVSLYKNIVTDLIEQRIDQSNNFIIYRNVDENVDGKVETKGIELELARKGSNGIEGRISYSFQNVKNTLTDAEIPNSPNQLAKANLILPLYMKKIFFGIEELYTSEKLTLAGQTAQNLGLPGIYTDQYYLTNLTLSTHDLITKGLDLSASIYNLFDKPYDDPGRPEHLQDMIQQNGINYRIKVTYQF